MHNKSNSGNEHGYKQNNVFEQYPNTQRKKEEQENHNQASAE